VPGGTHFPRGIRGRGREPSGERFVGQDASVRLPQLRRRGLTGGLIGAAGVAVVTLACLPTRPDGKAAPALLLVLPVLLTAIIGGIWPAVVIAAVSGLILAVVFLPPIGSPSVAFGEDVLALVVFLAVALAVSALVAAVLDAERRRLAADEARLAAMEGADEQRRALFRSVAHELRTPLGIVHATGTELLDAEVAHSPEVQEHLLRLLVAETSRLARIVENLLAMSRIDAAAWRMEREPVDVGRAVDAAAARVAGGRDGPPLTVAVQPGLPDVLADPVQLDLVLTNLIENAVRHGGPGRPVHVGASFEGDQAVQVTVADQGPGIDPAVAERAFEPFVTSGDGRSTGIGLALCRTIVNGHGGTIELRGAHGGGTVVVVTLPLP